MPGAALLAGRSAARSGAGLVTLAVPAAAAGAIRARIIVETMLDFPSTRSGGFDISAVPRLIAAASRFDVVALGPGLGTGREMAAFVKRVACGIRAPLVLDADGLNALDGAPQILQKRKAPTILTPHPGEAARLLNISNESIHENREGAARRIATLARTVVILKGHHSIITDGAGVYINKTGNPGMATGGSGDVLTGVVAALLGRGEAPLDAARLAAHIHGRAGDLAARKFGQDGLIATDILEFLPLALAERIARNRVSRSARS